MEFKIIFVFDLERDEHLLFDLGDDIISDLCLGDIAVQFFLHSKPYICGNTSTYFPP